MGSTILYIYLFHTSPIFTHFFFFKNYLMFTDYKYHFSNAEYWEKHSHGPSS